MAKEIMFNCKSAALRTFISGKREFAIYGITLTIQYVHDNQYQVLLPSKEEVFRIVDGGVGRVQLFVV